LDSSNFIEADNLFQKNKLLLRNNEYEDVKAEYIEKELLKLEKYLNKDPKKDGKENHFDEEKTKALAITSKDVLVQARAGSGKTTVIALKVWQLINFYGVNPNEILVLAFNNKAAKEFRSRINKYCKYRATNSDIATKSNTLTFHALAKRIANTDKNLLDGEKIFSSEDDQRGQDKKSQIDFCRNVLIT